MSKLEQVIRAALLDVLGEGIHTGFRKAIKHPDAIKIHNLIESLDVDDWSGYVHWLVDALASYVAGEVEAHLTALTRVELTDTVVDRLATEAGAGYRLVSRDDAELAKLFREVFDLIDRAVNLLITDAHVEERLRHITSKIQPDVPSVRPDHDPPE